MTGMGRTRTHVTLSGAVGSFPHPTLPDQFCRGKHECTVWRSGAVTSRTCLATAMGRSDRCTCIHCGQDEWHYWVLRVDAVPTADRPLLTTLANLLPRPPDGEDKTMCNKLYGFELYLPWLLPAFDNYCPLAKEGSCSEIAMTLPFGTSC